MNAHLHIRVKEEAAAKYRELAIEAGFVHSDGSGNITAWANMLMAREVVMLQVQDRLPLEVRPFVGQLFSEYVAQLVTTGIPQRKGGYDRYDLKAIASRILLLTEHPANAREERELEHLKNALTKLGRATGDERLTRAQVRVVEPYRLANWKGSEDEKE